MSKVYLGIEFGSTRIKAVTVDAVTLTPLSDASFSWKSELQNGVWTYDLEQAWHGLKIVLSQLEKTDEVDAIGISGMMHGYLAFDEHWNLLTPFRTWQNTMTAGSAKELTELFDFNIPQRWSSAHLFEAILRGEEHVSRVAHITTLAGYIHYMLTGVNAVGIGEASGIFPIDSQTMDYHAGMLAKLNEKFADHGFTKRAEEVFPKVLVAGVGAGTLTAEGANRLDGKLRVGTPFAPPEGDAGTGMVATNSVACRTGNVSAGTSIFAMVVLEKELSKLYEEVDMVTTPDGKPVAMVHCNNCTNEINEWASLFRETLSLFGREVSDDELYTKLYQASLTGAGDGGGIVACNYLSGEVLTGFERGVPVLLRAPGSDFSLGNLMRSQLYSAIATLAIGMEIFKQESVEIECLSAHGGLFKTKDVAQHYMAAACNTNIVCLETAGEGGPFGMALLAAYMRERDAYPSLDHFLNVRVFENAKKSIVSPNAALAEEFLEYMQGYQKMLDVERSATALF